MTHPHVDPNQTSSNPFDKPAAASEGRMAFGTLRVFTRKVNLTKGAEYIIDNLGIDLDNPDGPLNRLTDRNGNLWTFRGKQLTPNGSHTHVIPVITRRASDGRLYNDFRDFMYWQNDVCQKVTMPSLQKFFGQKLGGIWNKTAQVQAEVVEVEDGDYKRQAFKVIKVFKTKEDREAAETKFFSQFQQIGTEIADDIPGFGNEMDGEDPIPFGNDDKPVGMNKEAATALLPTLWAASGQVKDKFLDQLNGMPVVLTALGGIDAPEIQAIYS
jgi:hypothetical protein